MAQNKKSFIAYVDWKDTFDSLPDEKAGQLIKHLFAYVNDENPETDDILINAVFANIKQTLKRDLVKWEKTSSQRSDIGRLGGIKSGEARQSKSKQTKQLLNSRSKTKQNEHDSVSDSVSDNVSVNDIIYYFKDKGYTEESAKRFFEYYSNLGWKDSNGKKVKSWKSKAVAVWFKDENKEKPKSSLSFPH